MQSKVWAYFDDAETPYGRPWPIPYRLPERSAWGVCALRRPRHPGSLVPRTSPAWRRG